MFDIPMFYIASLNYSSYSDDMSTSSLGVGLSNLLLTGNVQVNVVVVIVPSYPPVTTLLALVALAYYTPIVLVHYFVNGSVALADTVPPKLIVNLTASGISSVVNESSTNSDIISLSFLTKHQVW